MKRNAYAGAAGISGDSSGGAVPLQVEASAYFGRMTVAPSTAFRAAVNQAIFDWKAQGNWANIKGLWLLCEDTAQAGGLSVIGDVPRDMTVNGTVTHTALKGFSGMGNGVAHQLVFPITSTILADDLFTTAIAANVNLAGGQLIENSNRSADGYGNVQLDSTGMLRIGNSFGSSPSGALSVVSGARGTSPIGGGGIGEGVGIGAGARGSIYTTSSSGISPVNNALQRLAALAYVGSASSQRMAQSFMITLSKLIDTLGALD